MTVKKLAGQSLLHLLHRASQNAESVFAAEFKDMALTPRQFAVLMAVAETEGLSQTDIVAFTGIDRATASDVVRRLRKKGLLTRHRAKDDTRAYEVNLTDEGRRVLRIVQPLAERIDDRILGVLSGGARKQFIDCLRSLVGALQGGARDDQKQ